MHTIGVLYGSPDTCWFQSKLRSKLKFKRLHYYHRSYYSSRKLCRADPSVNHTFGNPDDSVWSHTGTITRGGPWYCIGGERSSKSLTGSAGCLYIRWYYQGILCLSFISVYTNTLSFSVSLFLSLPSTVLDRAGAGHKWQWRPKPFGGLSADDYGESSRSFHWQTSRHCAS